MKTLLTSIAMSSLLAALAMAQPPRPRYTIKDLGALGGPGTISVANDMNNAGWVAGNGNLTPGGPQHAFLWYGAGPLKDLGTLGGPNSEAGGPNSSGEAAIISETGKTDPNGEDFCQFGTHRQCLGAIWRNGALTALRPLVSGGNSAAFGINNRGQVVGFAENGVPDQTCLTGGTPFQVTRFQGVIWQPKGDIQALRPLQGDTVGFAFGINENGQAAGTSGLCSNTSLPPSYPQGPHAVLWDKDGTPTNLGSLGGAGSMTNIASAINNRGEVVGGSQAKDGSIHGFIWTKHDGMQDLGTFPGALVTVPPCCNTINERGEVVGFWIDGTGNQRAFHWQDKRLTDLNDLIPAGSPWLLQSASSINNAGEIAGTGVINGATHAFLATPAH